MLKQRVQKLANELHATAIINRRHLHAHPELSFKEFRTSAFVKERLDQLEIPWLPMAGTGIVAMLEGSKPSDNLIALRADMDALPIIEKNNVEYASSNPGVMHACGHDAHTSSLLGTAAILQSMKDDFAGKIKLIFQPGEEKLPGGASIMISEGVLVNNKPSAVIAQHVSPNIPAGKIGIRKGKFMASMDEIFVTVKGRGGHGAQPHMNIDPVMISAQILVALQQVVSRMANPAVPTVLSFGKIIADGAINVIPDTVYLEGTFRALNEEWRSEAHMKMKKIAEGIAESFGGSCEFKIVRGYPFLINEERLTDKVQSYAEEYIGRENVLPQDIWMAAEDFSMFSQSADCCYYLMGIRNESRGFTSSLHTPTFDIDESALEMGMGLMAYIALKQLGN
ncbi:MAG TPA: M20 family metallopeptidase [Flavitalea sp.]|nr:M20 family metallopeptidase [Flavitalea sp.]